MDRQPPARGHRAAICAPAPMSGALLALLLVPFAGGIGAALGSRSTAAAALPVAITAAGAGAALALWLLAGSADGTAATLSFAWVPELDLAVDFRADRIALGAVLLMALIAGTGATRSAPRLESAAERRTRLAMLACIAGLSQALVLASNLTVIAAFASLDALLMLRLEARPALADERVRLALLLRLAGAWALLAAALLLRDATGGDALDGLTAQSALVKSQPLFPLLAALLWFGALSRAAAWPWSAWLAKSRDRTPGAAYAEPLLAITGVALALRFAPLTSAWLPPLAVAAALALAPLAVALAARALPAADTVPGEIRPPAGEPRP